MLGIGTDLRLGNLARMLALLVAGILSMGQGTAERDDLIAKAMASTKAAMAAAEADPQRPTYHFRAPANWMNDPNGTIYREGWYHVFYQFNPYGDQWGHMHWGHARSRDMVDWENLPVALWPTWSKGEEHIFSGSTFIDQDGKVKAFYTSIGQRDPEQWTARPLDNELIRWEKVDQPALNLAVHGDTKVDEWRDPFPFREGGKDYLLLGGNTAGKGSVFLYEALDRELGNWKFRGQMFQHPDSGNIECPNIAKIGNKWVLLVSNFPRVEAFVGTIDFASGKFTTEHRSVLSDGSYASQLLHDKDGHVIHFAWANTSDHKGWNGWLTLPSELTLTAAGELRRNPIAALTKLRTKEIKLDHSELATGLDLNGKQIDANHFEADLEFELGSATALHLKLGRWNLTYDVVKSELSTSASPSVQVQKGSKLRLHLFVDGSATDVYVNDGEQTLTGRIAPGATEEGLKITSDGNATLAHGAIYNLRPAKFDFSHFN